MKKCMAALVLAVLAASGCKNPVLEGRIIAYEEAEYVVRVENKAGGVATVSPQKDSYKANEQIRIEAAADDGYTFKEWQGNITGSVNPVIVKVTEDMWIAPLFEERAYYRLVTEWLPLGGTLYYDCGNGIFDAAAGKEKFLPGERCAIRAVPAAGYLFEGWQGDIESLNETIYITFDKDYQVYPKFSIIPTLVTYTITSVADTGGTVERYPLKNAYYENENVLVTAKANDGYMFKGWQGSLTGTANPVIVNMAGDIWLAPKFEPVLKYRLTTEWSPAGGALYYSYDGVFDTAAGKTEFLPGEQCAIRAVPAAGYLFEGWQGDIESLNDTIYITFDKDYQVYPKFSIIPTLVTYTLTAGALEGGAIHYVPSKPVYYENEIVTVTAKADSGYIFSRWGGDHTGNEISFNITMDSNKNIEASFIKREWSFIIYMAADNGLDGLALDDFNELEAVDYSGKPVSVLVLIDRINTSAGNWNDTRLYEVTSDPAGKNAVIVSARLSGTPELNISSGGNTELDTSNSQVLSGLIDYTKREYKADHYGLIIWGYGLGWKGCALDTTAGSSMPLSSLRGSVEGKNLSIIGFDTDFGVTLESAYELRNSAGYLVGSPGTAADPQKGWDYQSLFGSFLSEPSKTAKAFSDCIVGQYKGQYGATNGAGISVVELSKMGALFSAFEGFSGGLAGALTSTAARDALYNKMINGTIQMYYDGSNFPADAYADIYSMSLQGDGAALQNALSAAVSSWSSAFGAGRPLMGVFVNTLSSGAVFASGHNAGYRKNQGAILFVADSANYAPTGSSSGTSLLDKLFYY
jgi:hypothetical protein